ncbi:MAG TPA: GNAT family N-acetyltransferase [Terriglobales bacterium]|jgi:RimJ/RimL family protein N-acetyltransferase|nr:GNAT family N-acetyltransferase [Terriglobales bacterium]
MDAPDSTSVHSAGNVLLPGGFILKFAAECHLEGLDALVNDPAVAGWLGGTRSREAVLKIIQDERQHWARHGFGPWVIIDSSTGELIGRGGLRWTEVLGRPEVELFYAVTPAQWGKGIATAMSRVALKTGFSHPAVASVIAFTIHSNKASQRVAEKMRFRREGEFEHANLQHVLFRLTKSQYQEPHPSPE